MIHSVCVDLWLWRFDYSEALIARWHQVLCNDERERCARFKFQKDRDRFVVCRSRMRRILAWYQQSHPRKLRFDVGARGKPSLAMPLREQFRFNLSHTNDVACLAVAHGGREIGVDVEAIRSIDRDFMVRTLNPRELASLDENCGGADASRGFLTIWTAKEAYLKATGEGLLRPLKSFDAIPDYQICDTFGAVSQGDVTGQRYTAGHLFVAANKCEIEGWQLRSFAPTSGHRAALVVECNRDVRVVVRQRWFGGICDLGAGR